MHEPTVWPGCWRIQCNSFKVWLAKVLAFRIRGEMAPSCSTLVQTQLECCFHSRCQVLQNTENWSMWRVSQEENGNGNHVTRRITGETRTASTVKTELLVGGGGGKYLQTAEESLYGRQSKLNSLFPKGRQMGRRVTQINNTTSNNSNCFKMG